MSTEIEKYKQQKLPPREKRLLMEWEMIDQRCKNNEQVKYIVHKVNEIGLPIVYDISFNIRSIIGVEEPDAQGLQKPVFGNEHIMRITLSDYFPARDGMPEFQFLTDVWHPNIKYFGNFKGFVDVDCSRYPYNPLVEYIDSIIEYLEYNVYAKNEYPPYSENITAFEWIREQAEPQGWLNFAIGNNHGTTIRIEKLTKPKRLLDVDTFENHLTGINTSLSKKMSLICTSQISDTLVNFNTHSFLFGMYEAYAEHRPFVLSPDIIWLLIAQAFANHVNANAENLRHLFVKHEGKKTLTIQVGANFDIHNFKEWEAIFPQFTELISINTGKDLIDTLTADFSTTTIVERVSSQLTIMNAMKSYYRYKSEIICGIPAITILGERADWLKIIEKIKILGQYEFEWWVNEILPILKEFVNVFDKQTNIGLWRDIFNSYNMCGTKINGWILKFYPYDREFRKRNLNDSIDIGEIKELPAEILATPLLLENKTTGTEIKLELLAGFVGLEQDNETFALKPKIGWAIQSKISEDDVNASS